MYQDDVQNWGAGDDDQPETTFEEFEEPQEEPQQDAAPDEVEQAQTYIPPVAPAAPIVRSAPRAVSVSPAKKAMRQRRAKRRHRQARRAARRGGVRTASGACVGLGSDGEASNSVTFDLYKTGNGWSAILRLPTRPGKALMIASSPSPTKAAATRKSVNMAAKLSKNPLVQSVLPPQTRLALKAVQSPAGRSALKYSRKLF
jgi:hypothetical protein